MVKQHSNRTIQRSKDGLPIRADIQKEDVDYNKTFPPMVKMTIVRCILIIVVKKGWGLFQLDVNNTFFT